jgi:hypothetical protein
MQGDAWRAAHLLAKMSRRLFEAGRMHATSASREPDIRSTGRSRLHSPRLLRGSPRNPPAPWQQALPDEPHLHGLREQHGAQNRGRRDRPVERGQRLKTKGASQR